MTRSRFGTLLFLAGVTFTISCFFFAPLPTFLKFMALGLLITWLGWRTM